MKLWCDWFILNSVGEIKFPSIKMELCWSRWFYWYLALAGFPFSNLIARIICWGRWGLNGAESEGMASDKTSFELFSTFHSSLNWAARFHKFVDVFQQSTNISVSTHFSLTQNLGAVQAKNLSNCVQLAVRQRGNSAQQAWEAWIPEFPSSLIELTSTPS